MKIILKQIHLVNFKGQRDTTVEFDENITNIHGANGTGKTTIFDAFSWLLFGKDSKGREKFSLKTLNLDTGDVIPELEHEVSATILVDGRTMVLRKVLRELWPKKRGSATKEFGGNTTDCYIDDVPMSETDYKARIAEMCPESIFKLITNPLYFSEILDKKAQRLMLVEMAGEISDEQITSEHPELKELIESLSGKTISDYKREIANKKRPIKEELQNIPARIEERKRDIPEKQDWESIEKELKEKKEKRDSLQKDLCDIQSRYESTIKEANTSYAEKMREYQEKENELLAKKAEENRNITLRMDDIEDEQLKSYRDAMSLYTDYLYKRQDLSYKIERLRTVIHDFDQTIESLKERRESLLEEWKEIGSREQTYDESKFVCPTCKREFPTSNIEELKEHMQEEFNEKFAHDLKANKEAGMAIKEKIEGMEKERGMKAKELKEAEILYSKESPIEPKKPSLSSFIDNDATITELRGKYKNIEAEIAKVRYEKSLEKPVTVEMPNSQELKEAIDQLDLNVSVLRQKLTDKDKIDLITARVKELEEQQRASSQELANLENIEFQISNYEHVRMDKVQSRINSMFKYVTFRMYEKLINGGEVETCEAMLDGVPISTGLNNAGRFNAGIDIINAITKHYGNWAPIFIDNREGVTDIIQSDSQLINLYVNPHCIELTVK